MLMTAGGGVGSKRLARRGDLLGDHTQKAEDVRAEEYNVLVLTHHPLMLSQPLAHIMK